MMAHSHSGPPAPDITLAILAGGAGRRMGISKSLLQVGDKPILDYLLEEIAWPGPTLLVTAPGRESPPGHDRFTREIVDPIAGGGPLRGVLTALENVRTPLLVVLTVDMPGIRYPQIDHVLKPLLDNPNTLGLMTRRMVDGQPRIEPFPFSVRSSAQAIVARRLNEDQRSMHGLLGELGFLAVDAPAHWDDRVWINLNFPNDLLAFSASFAPPR